MPLSDSRGAIGWGLGLGAVGTVTYRDGDDIWAFGHPFEGLGRRSLFLQDSYVFGVISNPLGLMEAGAVTYKLASSAGHVLGSMTSDTTASVGGILGAEPPSIPLRVVAHHSDGREVVLQSRLADGYAELTLGGEETIDGAATWRLDDQPEPGTTASYWIDQASHLPRRIAIDRPGRRDVRVELAYGSGPRPVRAVAYLQGQRDVQVTLTPTYDSSGRAARIQAVIVPAGGSTITTDLTFDWSPGMGVSFFRFSAPAGSREVPFGQLSQGVLILAAGALGALLPVLLGAS